MSMRLGEILYISNETNGLILLEILIICKSLYIVILFFLLRHSTIKELKKKHILRAAWERVFNWHCHLSKDNGEKLILRLHDF